MKEIEKVELQESIFEQLSRVNVNEHVEKKVNLSYLSWSWALDYILRFDPAASWEYKEPVKWGDTVMVYCSVTVKGLIRTAYLPVMDHRNNAIKNPDSVAVNKAMQRCLVKAIALHGLGLYIYSGEDLPQCDNEEDEKDNGNVKYLKKSNAVNEIKELASEDEIDEFKLIASQANADINKILSYFKVDSVEKMTKTMVVSAIASIEKRSKQVN